MMITLFIVYMNLSQSKNASFVQKMKSFRPVTMRKMSIIPIIKQTTQQIGSALNTNVITITPEEKRIPLTPSTSLTPPAPTPTVPTPTIPSPTTPSTIIKPPPETSLYEFTSHTFTNAGASGRIGPTLEQTMSAYSSIPWAKNYITMTNNNGIQLWTVPKTGIYTIRALGGSGNNLDQSGGKGRDIETDVVLIKGKVIKILVGQQGINIGGGGGTFVVIDNNKPLLVAGGGGGGVNNFDNTWKTVAQKRPNVYVKNYYDEPNSNANDKTNGLKTKSSPEVTEYYKSGDVDVNGNNGSGGGASYGGSGGGGFYKSGENALTQPPSPGFSTGGESFILGGIGGNCNYDDRMLGKTFINSGGFGGGGAGYYYTGGGGGYSGGGGGGEVQLSEPIIGPGGGGGSFSSTDMTDNGATNIGHGKVIITFKQTTSPTLSPTLTNVSQETDLYQFTTHTFTNAGVSGRLGPIYTQIKKEYSSIPWALDYITMNNDDGIQLWTVPTTGKYTIRAFGASGNVNLQYGKGRDVQTTVTLKKGDIIRILVGQHGSVTGGYGIWNSGGGGGTYVVTDNYEPIIIAGGGGGSGSYYDGIIKRIPQINEKSNARGNINNDDGYGGNESIFGGGGGGFYKNGETGKNNISASSTIEGGNSFINGGIGGTVGTIIKCDGGFGGGGACDAMKETMKDTIYGGGGGGGYAGGNSGSSNNESNGIGGASYSSTEMIDNGATNIGHGKVIITLVT